MPGKDIIHDMDRIKEYQAIIQRILGEHLENTPPEPNIELNGLKEFSHV